MNSIALAFITGLTSGGISCLAVQGGLLSSAISQKEKSLNNSSIVTMFLIAKILGYTILGFGLGLLGASLTISATLQGWLQIFAGVYMLITAANLLNLHPVFRRFVIAPPRFAYRFMRKQSKVANYFSPAILGAMTIFIPCGITQGMMVIAISTANPLQAAGIMFAFTLGTSPIFFALGLAAAKFMQKKSFLYLSATAIIILGILSINTGQVLRGSVHTAQNYWNTITNSSMTNINNQVAGINTEGKQDVSIEVTDKGYIPSVNTLKVGVPVQLKLKTSNTLGCSRAFRIPSLGITQTLPQTGETIVEFTPEKTGRLAFTCSMGMFTGDFQVIN